MKLSELARACAIVAKYADTDSVCAEHDELWIGGGDETLEKMSAEDRAEMERLGWSYDGANAWHHFT